MTASGCVLCQNQEYRTLFETRNYRDGLECSADYVQCRKCSLIYMHPRPSWEEIVSFYKMDDASVTANTGLVDVEQIKKHMTRSIPGWKKILRRFLFRPHSWPLQSIAPGTQRILDMGCGAGNKLAEFAQRGYDVWGVDVNQQAIDICRKILPGGHFKVSDLEKMDLPEEFFDFIRIDNALEHVPDPRKVIEECRRLLKKNGRLMIYTPHGESLSVRVMKRYSISSWIPFHLHLFTRRSLKLLLSDGGFNSALYGFNPYDWISMSLMQWKGRKRERASLQPPSWLNAACFPLNCLLCATPLSEEIVAIAHKKT